MGEDSLFGAAIGAGAGLLKSQLVDKPKEERERRIAVAQARYSPWTGIKPQEVQEADPFGSMFQGGTAGLALGQGMDTANAQQGYQDKSLDLAQQNANSQNALNQAYINKLNANPAAVPMMNQSDTWMKMPKPPVYGP